LLLNRTEKSRTGIMPKVVILAIAITWMFCSYYFILQTYYDTPSNEMWGNRITDVATNDNAYLEEQEDGSYLFYYSGTAIPIPKEEVDAGMYDLYPIKPYSDNSGLFSTILEWLQTLK
ncbi:MAG: hypothetical protein MR410_08495, partial [Eubacterium sp.]|nr:hypothetical protein [Eubacterium sp.]